MRTPSITYNYRGRIVSVSHVDHIFLELDLGFSKWICTEHKIPSLAPLKEFAQPLVHKLLPPNKPIVFESHHRIPKAERFLTKNVGIHCVGTLWLPDLDCKYEELVLERCYYSKEYLAESVIERADDLAVLRDRMAKVS